MDYIPLVYQLPMYYNSALGRHPNDATPSQLMELKNEKRDRSEKWTKSENDPPQLLLFLLGARSLIGKIESLCLLVLSSNYDFLPITETWLNKYALDDATVIPGCQSFGRSRRSQPGGDCLVYVRNTIPATLCRDPQLNCVQDALGLILMEKTS